MPFAAILKASRPAFSSWGPTRASSNSSTTSSPRRRNRPPRRGPGSTSEEKRRRRIAMNEIRMKKTAVGAVLLGFVLLAGTLAARDRVEEKFARTEALDRNGKVSVENISGTIQVRIWDKAEVQIDAVKVSESSSEERAKENADKVRIEVVK